MKPPIPFDPIRYRKLANEELAAGMKKYNRRKAREKGRAAERKEAN